MSDKANVMDGAILIGSAVRHSAVRFTSIYPETGAASPLRVSEAQPQDVADACALADAAFAEFSALSSERRAQFLERIADAIADIGEVLITTACAETGLPRARIEGERGRSIGQLRMFAAELRSGAWMDIVIDEALPDRAPLARPDIRRINQAIGPIAVFGASNFPLAFSVAGGDTASGLAAGCPVVIKGHPAHPGTGELVARAIAMAVQDCQLHEGVFSYLPGASHALGAALVADPRIKAVGFTGSRAGGLALCNIAAAREEPIPVYAEMSSINPVILMPAALEARAEALGEAFVASLTLGAGQFCTNPGLVIAMEGAALDRFVASTQAAIAKSSPQTMLTPGIHASYALGIERLSAGNGVARLAEGAKEDGNRCSPAIFAVDAAGFLADRTLAAENFGASALLVRCGLLDEVQAVVAGLEGQLTISLHLDSADEADAGALMPSLVRKAGRILANNWPTGVEVCRAMVHGGPFPATTDVRTSSVGTLAMHRFLRPVCYQNFPRGLLPPTLA